MYQTEIGEIVTPSVRTKDGTEHTFTNARFHEGTFIIATKVESRDSEPQEGEYTVPQLREMLSDLLQPRPTLNQRIIRILRRKD